MKKLSNIIESFWGDVHKRSRGDEIRKEDDIDILDGHGFCDYLNTVYIDKSNHKIVFDSFSKRISIAIIKKYTSVSYSITYDYKSNIISMNEDIEEIVPELCEKIKENYNVTKQKISQDYTKFIISPLDGSECTNSFYINVINFIIDNCDKNKLQLLKKDLNESFWGDVHKRSRGDEIRKEDDIVSNIKELKPVDMGCSVLWADRDIESDENVYFSFPDANKIIKNSEWRLPTFNEMIELNKNVIIYKNTIEEYMIHWYATNSDLIFEKCGYQYADEDRVREPDSYYAWTSDEVKCGNEAYRTIRIGKYISAVPMHYMNRCCIRLVKDK